MFVSVGARSNIFDTVRRSGTSKLQKIKTLCAKLEICCIEIQMGMQGDLHRGGIDY